MARRAALIVASDTYEDEGLRRLAAAAGDAAALAEVLADPAIGGFEVQTLVNEPSHHVAAAIEEFFSESMREDLLLLYFSGHGVKDESGRLHFAMTNTKRKLLGSTAVAATFVNDAMGRGRARAKVVLLDCCFAGAFAKGSIAKADDALHTADHIDAAGTVVLTASDSTQYSFEGDELSGSANRSVFTHHVVEGLRGPADADGDGEISVDELYDYLFAQVSQDPRGQRPQKNATGVTGKLTIARCEVKPGQLPESVLNAVRDRDADVRLGMVSVLERYLQHDDQRIAAAARIELEALADDRDRHVAEAAQAVIGSRVAAAERSLPPQDLTPDRPSLVTERETVTPERAPSGETVGAVRGAVFALAAVVAVFQLLLVFATGDVADRAGDERMVAMNSVGEFNVARGTAAVTLVLVIGAVILFARRLNPTGLAGAAIVPAIATVGYALVAFSSADDKGFPTGVATAFRRNALLSFVALVCFIAVAVWQSRLRDASVGGVTRSLPQLVALPAALGIAAAGAALVFAPAESHDVTLVTMPGFALCFVALVVSAGALAKAAYETFHDRTTGRVPMLGATAGVVGVAFAFLGRAQANSDHHAESAARAVPTLALAVAVLATIAWAYLTFATRLRASRD